MKQLFFFIFFLFVQTLVKSQTLPVIPLKKAPAQEPSKSKPVKSKTVTVARPDNTATIKFLSDADATLYIDSEKKGSLKKDIPLRIKLPKGEYILKVVSIDHEEDFTKWNYNVEETGIEKLVEISLQGIITERLNTESVAREAQLRKEAVLNSIQNIEMITVGNFAIGKYEITQLQWMAVMGSNPSANQSCDICPVEQVNWTDVQEFIQKLNALTGKKYRLPTLVEWEIARNDGYNYAGSNDKNSVAWNENNSGGKSHPVGQKQANELGIYDLTGNVGEWCSSRDDPSLYDDVYGGSWSYTPNFRFLYSRDNRPTPNSRLGTIGFRLACSL